LKGKPEITEGRRSSLVRWILTSCQPHRVGRKGGENEGREEGRKERRKEKQRKKQTKKKKRK